MKAKDLADATIRRHMPKQPVTASSVRGLVRAAMGIIAKEVAATSVDYIVERTELVTDTTITKNTIKRWLSTAECTPHLSKLNAVLNACGYHLSISGNKP